MRLLRPVLIAAVLASLPLLLLRCGGDTMSMDAGAGLELSAIDLSRSEPWLPWLQRHHFGVNIGLHQGDVVFDDEAAAPSATSTWRQRRTELRIRVPKPPSRRGAFASGAATPPGPRS